MPDAPTSRFATIVLAGRPNAGKSTLLNALVGERLAGVSPKPQTTREPVYGVVTEGDTQLLFVDSPGLLEPRYRLQQAMLGHAHEALRAADGILFLHPVDEGDPPPLETLLPDEVEITGPVLTVLSKADLFEGAVEGDRLAVSALHGQGIGELFEWCRQQATPGPFRYDPDDIGTQPLRFFAAEYVREAAFAVLGQELPYVVAVTVDEFREGETPVYIRLTLHVERESQKGMVIGKGGRTVKALGERARARIEALLGAPVYLDLWVKVWPKWRSSPEALRRLGFPIPTERKS